MVVGSRHRFSLKNCIDPPRPGSDSVLTEGCCVAVTEEECSSTGGEEQCDTQQEQDCRQTFQQVQSNNYNDQLKPSPNTINKYLKTLDRYFKSLIKYLNF